jgi:hypothetical protein
MRFHKFEKIVKSNEPIIRITYVTWYGSHVVRDVCKCKTLSTYWIYMDNGNIVHNHEPITAFYRNDMDVYIVNKSEEQI